MSLWAAGGDLILLAWLARQGLDRDNDDRLKAIDLAIAINKIKSHLSSGRWNKIIHVWRYPVLLPWGICSMKNQHKEHRKIRKESSTQQWRINRKISCLLTLILHIYVETESKTSRFKQHWSYSIIRGFFIHRFCSHSRFNLGNNRTPLQLDWKPVFQNPVSINSTW